LVLNSTLPNPKKDKRKKKELGLNNLGPTKPAKRDKKKKKREKKGKIVNPNWQ